MRITPSGMFLLGCTTFIVGVFVATKNPTMEGWVMLAIGVFILLAGYPHGARFGSRRFWLSSIGIVLIAFAFGVIRTNSVLSTLAAQNVVDAADERVELLGRVASYPDTGLTKSRFIIDVIEPYSGRVLITSDRGVAPSRGDVVRVVGKLRIPKSFETDTGGTFNYPMFLAKDGVTALLRTNTLLVETPAQRWSLASVRSAIDRSAVSILPFREGAILKAVLIGDEGSMTDSFKDALNASGLRHIVAVSGMNIAIILGLIAGSVRRLGGSKKQAFGIGFIAVSLFVLLIGAPASALRAAIMGIALVAAPLLSRRGSGLRAAVAAAALMVAMSPLTLVYDVGFQLSFLAVIGIILFGSSVHKMFVKLPPIIAETLAMTFAAQIMVTPLLLSVFGGISLVSPISNLIVVPAIAIVTVWGFLAVLLGIVWLPLGSLIALPLLPYFSIVAFVAETFGAFGMAKVTLSGVWLGIFTLMWYCIALMIAYRLQRQHIRPIDLVKLR